MIICIIGCREKETAVAADIAPDEQDSNRAAEPGLKRAEYENDIDRLARLSERINRACRASYVVVLSAGESAMVGGTVTVDYTLFDKLSDDGVAVLVAEAIAAKSIPLSSSQMQIQTNTERVILQVDETAGRYVVKAGFRSAGFAEWLDAKKLSTMGLQEGRVPEKMRIAAFMRGYTSERYSKER
jgi:hypothetical protein